MKIMLLPPEVIDTHTRRLIDLLLHYDYEVICVSNKNPKPEGALKFRFIKYPKIYFFKRKIFWKFSHKLTDWAIGLKLYIIWKSIKPDVVHVLYINLRAYQCVVANLKPLILTALGSDINDFFDSNNFSLYRKSKIKKALLKADFITADTNEILQRVNKIANKNIESGLFYFGIDLNLFRPRLVEEKKILRKRLGLLETSKIILSPRRLTKKMNHHLILEAFAKLKLEDSIDAVLIFRSFGCENILIESELRNLAIKFGVSDSILWLEEIDYTNIPILYSLADIVMNIPTYDGFPVTLTEVAACKTPIVLSNISAYNDFPHKNDFIKIKIDPNEIYSSMKDIILKKYSFEKSVESNYNLVRSNFDQDKCFNTLNSYYRKTHC